MARLSLGCAAAVVFSAIGMSAALGCRAAAPLEAARETGRFANGEVQLSFQLDTPAGRPPFPAVVVGHGSGRTRKEDCRGLANQMLRRGYATLCFDKRGVGDSTGDYVNVGTFDSEARFPLLASDLAAGVEFLRADRRIDRRRVGLMGPSQAGWIIPLAAQRSTPAFMILLVGPTVSVGEEMYYSKFAEQTTTPLAELAGVTAKYTGPRGFDPRPVLETLNVPGLWLLGDADRSIPVPETLAILDDLRSRGRPFTRIVYQGVGHDMRGADFWRDVDRWLADLR
jgi:dienelactone hydrolase